ncbi:TRAP transporter substrate-binding protein [Salibacterium salarium]|uniref:TRAP transporter substrate-binding protein n=1 Tax=Salibacterium salarium TaxID=284579 RepID=A0A428N674_9BACI|nr:TRAP transporter substrate-binding protein [Salibacterium salarium]RSL33975.1 TRAP transporter substrate-binding protein [Salibacterium salarium]
MNNKKWLTVMFAFALMLLLAACGGSSDGETEDTGGDTEEQTDTGEDAGDETEAAEESSGDAQTLRISIGVTDAHPEYEGAMKFKELVEEQTDDFEVEVYHSGQIAGDREAAEMLQQGTLEITIPSTSPMVNFVPEYGVFDLPFTIPNEEVADAVLDGPFGDKMLGMLEDQGMVGLAWWENGFRNLTNSSKPVSSVDDLEGLDLRTMENDIHLDAWNAMGANPTPMAFPELFSALQQGTIDGQENPYPTIDTSNFYEVQDYLSGTNHVYTPFIFLISKQIWDGFSEEQQTILREAAVEAGKFNRERNREVADESLEMLKEEMEFSEITDEELERFRDAVEPVIEDHKSSIGAEVVDEYLAEIEKHE